MTQNQNSPHSINPQDRIKQIDSIYNKFEPPHKIAVFSNEKLQPWVNWSTLGPPLWNALARFENVKIIAPPSLSEGSIKTLFESLVDAWRCDTLFWMQPSSRPEKPIHAVASLRGWVRRSAFVVDPWKPSLEKIGLLARLQRLNPCFLPYSQSLSLMQARFGRGRFEWLPFGVDTHSFRPHDAERPVFAYWMGRRYEPLHQKLLAYCEKHNLVYKYTKKPGEYPSPEDIGRQVASAQYFVVTPPDLDQQERTGGISPLVMRYMEGLAAGAKLLGVMPRSGEYERMLPMNCILTVEPDGSDLDLKLNRDRAAGRDTEALEAGRRLIIEKHSWEVRARQIYRRLQTDQPIAQEEFFLK